MVLVAYWMPEDTGVGAGGRCNPRCGGRHGPNEFRIRTTGWKLVGALGDVPGGDFLGRLQRSPAKITAAVTVNNSDAVKRALGGT